MNSIDLNTNEVALVNKVLSAVLPKQTKVWVFGSRAAGQAKPFSDLDLAIDAGQKLSLAQLAMLSELFEESALPYKVDIVDMQAVSARFKQEVDGTKLAFGLSF